MTNKTPSESKQNFRAVLALVLTLAAGLSAWSISNNGQIKVEQVYLPQQQVESVPVCVLTVDFGGGPLLWWSNSRAEQNADGTVTISTKIKGNSQ